MATRKWEHGFCDCFDDSDVCCMSFWCPCVLFSKTKYRLRNPSMEGFSCCNLHCVLHCICINTPVACIMRMLQRKEIREKYNLEGGCCGDCMKSCCCPCCELIQEENEVVGKQKAVQATAAAGGYQKSPAMVYNAAAGGYQKSPALVYNAAAGGYQKSPAMVYNGGS